MWFVWVCILTWRVAVWCVCVSRGVCVCLLVCVGVYSHLGSGCVCVWVCILTWGVAVCGLCGCVFSPGEWLCVHVCVCVLTWGVVVCGLCGCVFSPGEWLCVCVYFHLGVAVWCVCVCVLTWGVAVMVCVRVCVLTWGVAVRDEDIDHA